MRQAARLEKWHGMLGSNLYQLLEGYLPNKLSASPASNPAKYRIRLKQPPTMRPTKLILPNYRPRVCAECPLCGVRPQSEMAQLEPGCKWTHKCMMDDRLLSGRGIKQPDARNRCRPKVYEKMYFTCQGNFLISPIRMEKYSIQQTKLLFAPQ